MTHFSLIFIGSPSLESLAHLITVGGQHQGVYGLPHCRGVDYSLCEYIRELLDYGAYISYIQESLVFNYLILNNKILK
jgi:palmitoyl-protein thioesterase